MASIKLENVYKNFGKTTALKNLNIEIFNGEFFVLLGPTGAGKTTTLRIISGLEQPDRGKIFFDKEIMNDVQPAFRDTSYVFQQFSLYPHYSVYDNLAFPLRSPLRKEKKEVIDKKVTEIAKLLKIDNKLKNKATQLSGGEMQRVSLGRALVRNPNIYLMDEPLSSLDAKLREELRIELKKIQKDLNATILYVTHDHVEATTMADRIGVLKDGVLSQVGTPEEIYNDPSNVFVAQFIGTPKMNILEVSDKNIISENSLKLLGLEIKFNNIKFEKTKHYVGIRPEHLKVNDNNDFTFNPEIELIENLGNEKIVYMQKDKNQLSSKIPSNIEVSDTIGFNYQDLLIFDKNKIRIKF